MFLVRGRRRRRCGVVEKRRDGGGRLPGNAQGEGGGDCE